MRSSISSSRPARALQTWRTLGLFLLVYAGVSFTGEYVVKHCSTLGYARIGLVASDLPSDPHYADIALGVDSLSHAVFYHGIGASVDNARDADVLLIGDSRMNFGFPSAVLQAFADQHAVTFYNLGMGYGEKNLFFEKLIELHNIQSRIVVVNADGFFVDEMSKKAKEVVCDGEWNRFKRGVEFRGLYLYVRFGRGAVPHFLPKIPPPYGMTKREAPALYRSVQNGCWFVWTCVNKRVPVRRREGTQELSPTAVEAGRRLRRLIDAHGGKLVLTQVPSSEPDRTGAYVEELAKAIEVPLVKPLCTGLVTLDGSHLDGESATRFAWAFLQELGATPTLFRDLIAESLQEPQEVQSSADIGLDSLRAVRQH